MKRFVEARLNEWIKSPFRKPLLLRGARQVGKSTLVRNFSAGIGKNLVEINLEKHPYLDPVFKTLNTKNIIRELEGLTGQQIKASGSILFLDEIQATPWALQSLRYFYEEEPEIPVIAAGSLLEIILSKHNFSMPVGRIEYLYLGPMSFEEYLYEKDRKLLEYITQYELGESLPQTVHAKLSESQREYLFVGGMPEAVLRFLRTDNFKEAINASAAIIETYKDDFSKYARQNHLIRLHQVLKYVPSAVGKKIKYSNISAEEKSREIKHAIDLLSKAGLIIPVYHSGCSGVPLSAQEDEKVFKLLFLDVGLLNYVCGLDWMSFQAFDNIRLINEGSIAEQFIGQHLLYMNPDQSSMGLHYWLRERKINNAEVDYVISQGDLIVPVEVKAGKSGSLKSIVQFVHEKKKSFAIRFDLNPPSIQSVHYTMKQSLDTINGNYQLVSLPLYLVGQINRLIQKMRK